MLAAVLAISATGCQRSAPELPPDYGSVDPEKRLTLADFNREDARLSCGQIDTELRVIADGSDQLDSTIHGDRSQNQAVGYVAGVLFPPVLFAAEHHTAEKKALDRNQKRRDELFALKRVKNCPN